MCQNQLCVIYRRLWNWLSPLRYRNWKTTCLFMLCYWDSVLPQASRSTDRAEGYEEGPSCVQEVDCIKTELSWTAVWVTRPAMPHPRTYSSRKSAPPFFLTRLPSSRDAHLPFYLNINQLDALNFIMSLFHASTCFEHTCSSSGGQNSTIKPLVSSHL